MRLFLLLFFVCTTLMAGAQNTAVFRYDTSGFYLNEAPFQIWSGEMHFQRIPRLYWADRIAKAKALGLNTLSTYVFWNALEPKRGRWNFQAENDLVAFIREAQAQGMYVLLRPGPYVCGEWDMGGLPAWLLAKPGIRLRSSDPAFLQPVLNYIQQIAERIRPLQVQNGGNVLMLQVENEFGSYGQDAAYLKALRDAWKQEGITLALYTADGPGETMLKNGSVPGCIVGLDPGANAADFAQARKFRPDVPAFCSEYYPGWLTHWGENWARTDTLELLRDLKWLIQHGKSWNLYMLHGGTNFGFYAGANMAETYQPDLTSYDYDAPIREDGSLTPKYFAIRRLIQKYSKNPLPAQPRAVMRMGLGVMQPQPVAHVMDLLPAPRASENPLPMEQYGQNFGCILYRITLAQAIPKGAVLEVNEVHDYAQVYINKQWIGTLDRTKKQYQLALPAATPAGAQLDILVEGMGRINYGRHLADMKGITEKVTLNAQILTGWQVHNLPFEDDFVQRVGPATDTSAWNGQPGRFFRAEFHMASLGDTYLDMSGWQKGYVWVNGRHLGRYWNRGPQQRLYVPGSWMRKGANTVLILDFHQTVSAPVRGFESLEGN